MDWAILRTRPTTRLVRAGVLAAVALGLGADPAGAATFEVNSTGDQNDLNPGDGLCRIADPGPCTLRAAIEEANALANSPAASPDVINFEIGAGVQTISLTTGALPTVTDPVTIDGYSESGASPNTQPGFAGAFAGGGAGSNATLQIELDLNDKAGLVISGGGSTVKGLAIYGVRERIFIPGDPPTLIQSHAIELRTGSGNKVQGNFIGLSAAGTAPAFADLNKQPGVGVISGDDHTIGGTDPADRNVISANGGANGSGGIHVEGGSNSVIQGNLIGTTPDGTDIPTVLDFEGNPVDINNGQFGGIQVSGFNPGTFPIANLTIGGTAPGAGNLVSGNLHDANSGAIHIFGNWTTPEVHVLGNRVGTDVTGTAALGNITGAGIYALGTTEIGDDQGHGNLVSGNGLYGLRIDGEGHTIQGNRIGTNASGTSALPNSNGIWTRAEGMLIGGTTPLAGNLISGNDQDGITGDSYDGNDIQGNFIGTNAAGTAPVPNGFAGISVPGGVGNTIGGAAQNADNVISGNGAVGVLLTHPGEGSSATQNEVLGNKIGTNDAGTAAIQNGGPGIQAHIAGRNVLGRPSEGNVIAHNADDGVLISGTDGQFGSDVFENDGNSIRGNSIFSNGQLGIDLGEDADDPFDDGDGVTANDAADQDAGNNELQNVPVVTGALPSASTFVRGALNSRPGTTYTIDVYSTATCDSSGSGEGGRWLGQATTATNGSGDGVWSTTVAETVPAGEFVTATATDPSGNTSEFAACRESGTQTAEPDPPPPDTPVTPQQQAPVQQNPTPTPPSPSCADKKAPITTLKKAGVKNDRRGAKLVLNGRSADHRDCPSGVNRVDVSLARVAGRTGVNCRFIKKPNRTGLTRRQNCRRPVLFRATGTDRWTFTFPVRLPKGLYRVQARGTDRARNKETPKKNRNIVFFEVK